IDLGITYLDTSPDYGSEPVLGEVMKTRCDEVFLATKINNRSRDGVRKELEDSLKKLETDHVDLIQVHAVNAWADLEMVLAPDGALPALEQARDEGLVRYIGITHYTASAYPEVEAVLKSRKLDFLQINYAFDDREAAERLLPLAADRGVAVIVNRPFGGGGLLRRLRDEPLPGWAAEIGATSWAQVLLKFVLSHPAVTCAIPGTSRAEHMADNVAAGRGVLPEPGFWAGKVLPG
ncbi:MAG: aldo/keto reductase, partial [Rhizobacter sp.]